jgi:hypothetical protein
MRLFEQSAKASLGMSNRTEQGTNQPVTVAGQWGRSTVSAIVYGLRNGGFGSPEAERR